MTLPSGAVGATRPAPAEVRALLRSRPLASGANFSVQVRRQLQPGAGSSPSAAVVMFSVPKRQLARAVDRNLVRRVARECWRESSLSNEAVLAMIRLRARPEPFVTGGVRARRLVCRNELVLLLEAAGRRFRRQLQAEASSVAATARVGSP